jgi:hypothetical protein
MKRKSFRLLTRGTLQDLMGAVKLAKRMADIDQSWSLQPLLPHAS